ncbi:hypothetical protein BKA66DRAFT_437062 [Pyrenochaeta sp. MPI-SDFR-AT-0127]|nr:hypothetical protein BKA66DRAFT_437062 [Pyrenochaeta sp. MPI-SDFR-AT-0127]
MALQMPNVTIDDLRDFHVKHFPHTPVPENFLHGVETEAAEEYYEEEDDGLGYYPDGKKRTLTDEQIAMFRHSEIQSILRKRRLRLEDGEISEDEFAATGLSCTTPSTSDATTPHEPPAVPTPKNLDKVQAGRVEKPKQQQWATSSARTKAKNKRNRDKYKAKKKGLRIQKDIAKRNARHGEDDDESDEWDPWHQANGPDVQRDNTLDLDY